jgi:hypothetical protein
MKTGTDYFAIHSIITQSWFITKNNGRETDTILLALGGVEPFHCCQKFSNKANACT